MKTTIRMVADYVGVSRGTVDRVLHNRGNVNLDVVKKVKKALKELDYTPNTIARALVASGNARKLGVLLPYQPGFFRDEVLRAVKRIEVESQDLGVEICVREYNALVPEAFAKAANAMESDGVCGFTVCAQNTVEVVDTINNLSRKDIPVITVNSDIPDSGRICFVGEDAIKSGQVAAGIIWKHLKEQEDILVVAGTPGFTAHENRVLGFSNYLKEKGIAKERCQIIYTNGNDDLAYTQAERMLREYPSIRKVYIAIDCVAGYAKALANIELPGHLFTVTHDTAEDTLAYLKNGLIDFTIDQDLFSQGYRPLQILIDYFLYGKPIAAVSDKIIYHIISAECVE